MSNTPKLRFKDFEGEWRDFKIGNVLTIKSGKDQKNVICENGEYPILGTGGEIGRTNSFLYDKESVLIGRKGTIDKPMYKSTPFWTVDTLFYSEIKENFFPKMIFYSFQNINWKKYCEATGVPSLNKSTIESVSIKLPSLPEQEKIANFLSLIDKKIELQEEKLNLSKEYKKGMMQKIFSQELRFKDENGENYSEWEVKKLGELGEFYSSGNLSKSDVDGSGEPCLLYGDLYTLYNESITNIHKFTQSSKRKVYGKFNDLIFPTSTTANAYSLISPSALLIDNVLLGGDMVVFRPYNTNSLFLSYQINNLLKAYFSQFAQGSTIIHIYANDLKLCKVRVPSLPEQEKIANFLSKLDEKIDLEQEKLDLLKEYKKGLLQQMFV